MKHEEITAMMDEGPVADFLLNKLQFPKGCKWGILQEHQLHDLLTIALGGPVEREAWIQGAMSFAEWYNENEDDLIYGTDIIKWQSTLLKSPPSPAEPRICEQDALKAVMNVLINMIAEHGEVPAAAAVHIMKTLQDDSMRPIIEAVFALPTTTETGD